MAFDLAGLGGALDHMTMGFALAVTRQRPKVGAREESLMQVFGTQKMGRAA